MRPTSKLALLSVAILLVAAACSDDDTADEESVSVTGSTGPSTTTATTVTAPAAVPGEVPSPADITETHQIPAFGYSIDYPDGWFAETRGTITVIAQSEEQLRHGFSDADVARVALSVVLDHRPVAFLQEIGLISENPTSQDLLDFNANNFDWGDIRDLGEVEVFGASAAVARVAVPESGFSMMYQGVSPDAGEAFLFGFGAPTEESLDAFLPTWEAMFESISAIE